MELIGTINSCLEEAYFTCYQAVKNPKMAVRGRFGQKLTVVNRPAVKKKIPFPHFQGFPNSKTLLSLN